MTLPEALALALEWCGDDLPEKLRWKAGYCTECPQPHEDIDSLPPLTHELAMAMLVVLRDRIEDTDDPQLLRRAMQLWFDHFVYEGYHPAEAIVYAVGELAGKEKGR